jgi:hypothetical protein
MFSWLLFIQSYDMNLWLCSEKEEYRVHHKAAQCYLKQKHFSRAKGK